MNFIYGYDSLALIFILAAMGPGISDVEGYFRELFDQHYSGILGYFRRLTDPALSEDLCQETFVRAYKNMSSFREEAQPKTWLRRIAENVWRNHLRDQHTLKRKAEEVSLSNQHGETLASKESPMIEHAIRDERQKALLEAIHQLPVGMQSCVRLRIYQDLSYQEVATVLGIGVASAKSQVSLARSRLGKILGGRYPELFEETVDISPAVEATR